jgi:hypothetical protein
MRGGRTDGFHRGKQGFRLPRNGTSRTPKHGSWLNVAEIERSVLARQCLDRRIPDQETRSREVAAWERDRNAVSVKVDWQFRTAEARVKLKRLYPVLEPNESAVAKH